MKCSLNFVMQLKQTVIARAVDCFPVKVQAFNVVGQGEVGVIFTLAVEEMGQVHLQVWDPG